MAGKIRTIRLETPITVGKDEIAEVRLRKPSVGSLRGLQISTLQMQDVNAMLKLLPRITTPVLDEAALSDMDLGDFSALSLAVVSFLAGSSSMLSAMGSD